MFLNVLRNIASFGLLPIIISIITSVVVTKKHRVYDLDNKIYFYDYQKLDKLNECVSHKISKANNLVAEVNTYKSSYYNSDDSTISKEVLQTWSKKVKKDISDLRSNELSLLSIYIRELKVIYKSLNYIRQSNYLSREYKYLFNEALDNLNNANKDVPKLYVNYYGNHERKGINDAGHVANDVLINLKNAYGCIIKIQILGLQYDNRSILHKKSLMTFI